MKPLALDLCCGKGGWTIGLLKAGWDVIGVDIEYWPGYPSAALHIPTDVRNFRAENIQYAPWYKGRKVELVVASPPCQEFSYRASPWSAGKKLPPPDQSIWMACWRIAQELKAPLIIENVRGAQKYMGKADWHCGSFYLWGNVPALLPTGKWKKGMNWEKVRGGKGVYTDGRQFSSKSEERKEHSAKVAMIPEELSTWIGECYYPRELRNVKS